VDRLAGPLAVFDLGHGERYRAGGESNTAAVRGLNIFG
jgi:hypothetical protein